MNIEFFKKQYKARAPIIHDYILRKNTVRNVMSKNKLDKMIAENIRGLDEASANEEIHRLTILNNNSFLFIPEKHRIQKLIYAEGRNDLTDPSNISLTASINRLGNRLVTNSEKLPFSSRSYQFLIDLAQEQNNSNYKSSELLVVDIQKNRYDDILVDDFKTRLSITDEQLNGIISKIINNNSIVMYINPHDNTSIQLLQKLTGIAKEVNITDLERLLFPQPITKSDTTDLKNEIVTSMKKILSIQEDALSELEAVGRDNNENVNKVISKIDDIIDEKNEELISGKSKDIYKRIVQRLIDKGTVTEDIINLTKSDLDALDEKELSNIDSKLKKVVIEGKVETQKKVDELAKEIGEEEEEEGKEEEEEEGGGEEIEIEKKLIKIFDGFREEDYSILDSNKALVQRIRSIINKLDSHKNIITKEDISRYKSLDNEIKDRFKKKLKKPYKPVTTLYSSIRKMARKGNEHLILTNALIYKLIVTKYKISFDPPRGTGRSRGMSGSRRKRK